MTSAEMIRQAKTIAETTSRTMSAANDETMIEATTIEATTIEATTIEATMTDAAMSDVITIAAITIDAAMTDAETIVEMDGTTRRTGI